MQRHAASVVLLKPLRHPGFGENAILGEEDFKKNHFS